MLRRRNVAVEHDEEQRRERQFGARRELSNVPHRGRQQLRRVILAGAEHAFDQSVLVRDLHFDPHRIGRVDASIAKERVGSERVQEMPIAAARQHNVAPVAFASAAARTKLRISLLGEHAAVKRHKARTKNGLELELIQRVDTVGRMFVVTPLRFSSQRLGARVADRSEVPHVGILDKK